MAKTRTFGRLHAPDPRDQRFAVRARRVNGTKHWNEGKWQGDQGAFPHCVGYGFAHWLSGAPIGQYVDPDGIYKIAKFFDEWDGEAYDGTSVRAGAKVLELLGFIQEYRWAFDVDAIASAILTTGPVVVGTNWYSGMDKADSKGRIKVSGRLVGGHCYIINGYSSRTGLHRIKNSWPEWEGRYIHDDDLARLISEDGEACLAIERKVAPR